MKGGIFVIKMNRFAKRCFEGGVFRNTIQTTNNSHLRRFLKLLNLPVGAITRYLYSKKIKVIPNKIMFLTFQNDFKDNQKYIALELLKRDLPLEIVFSVSKEVLNQRDHIPPKIRVVERDSAEYYYDIMSSAVLVDNAFVAIWMSVPKMNGQTYINTWHGSMGLKRIDKGSDEKKYWEHIASKADKVTDYMISNSLFENDVYRSTHWPTTNILEFGHPRNDILFQSDSEESKKIKEKVYSELGIDPNYSIVLYAPTFRKNKKIDETYDIDYDLLISSLEKRFGGQWAVVVRYHFHNRKAITQSDKTRLYDATEYEDMQELMIASDVGVSDYSSWVCDFVLLRRPIFLFAKDYQKYKKERGFYYPLEDTPFELCLNNEELSEKIRMFNYDVFLKKVDVFLKERGSFETGNASKETVDFLLGLLSED